MISRSAAAFVLCAALAACGSKSNVTLSAALGDASLTISTASPLVTELAGGFTLDLELGAEAAAGTDVSIGNFLAESGGGSGTSLTLKVATDVPFPVHLGPGDKSSVHFTIAENVGAPGQMIDGATAQMLCAAAPQILGTVTDSAQDGRATQVGSPALAVGGCGP